MITNLTTSYEGATSELIDLLVKRDQEIASLKAGNVQMEKEWNGLQDWIQVLTEAHTYYRQAIKDAIEAIDADDTISAHQFLEEAFNNMDYIIEWKEWTPDEKPTA